MDAHKSVASLADAWIETVSSDVSTVYSQSRPSRTRGLKRDHSHACGHYRSRPSRTRGLKLPVMFDVQCSKVASLADAWIETHHHIQL